jgi:hypothetical protein
MSAAAARTPRQMGDLDTAMAGAPRCSIWGVRSEPASAVAIAPKMAPLPTRVPG